MLSPAARPRARRREMLLVVALWLAWQEAPAAPTPAADDITRGVVSYPRHPPGPLRSHPTRHPPLWVSVLPPDTPSASGHRRPPRRWASSGGWKRSPERPAARCPPALPPHSLQPVPSSLYPLLGAPLHPVPAPSPPALPTRCLSLHTEPRKGPVYPPPAPYPVHGALLKPTSPLPCTRCTVCPLATIAYPPPPPSALCPPAPRCGGPTFPQPSIRGVMAPPAFPHGW